MITANVVEIDTNAFINANTGCVKPHLTSVDLSYMPFTNNDMSYAFYANGVNASLTSVTNINNNVTNMVGTFVKCRNLTDVPSLPTNVQNLAITFASSGIANCPVIPNSVTNLYQTFGDCPNIVTPPAIPNSVTALRSTFMWDTGLSDIPSIPNSVTSLVHTFIGCTNLRDMANTTNRLPDSIEYMAHTFAGCSNMTTAPSLSNNSTDIFGAFYGCSRLTNTPTIPDSVVEMAGTFCACYNLTNITNLPPNVTNLGAGGSDLAPESPDFHHVGSGTFAYCRNLPDTAVPTIPNSVTDMTGTFAGCKSFVNTPTLPQNVVNIAECFMVCNNLTNASTIIPATVTNMKDTFSDCRNLTGNINIISNQITNTTNCFYNTSATKNVYIPFTYTDGTFTTTYNTFTSCGYTTNGAKEGVYLKDNDPVTLTISPTPSTASVSFDSGVASGNSCAVTRNANVTYTLSAANYDTFSNTTSIISNTTVTQQMYKTTIPWSSSSYTNTNQYCNWWDITTNGSIFVLLSKDGQVGTITTPASTGWTINTSTGLGGNPNYAWYGIDWNGSRFVVLDRKGWVSYSTDSAATWATRVRDTNLASVVSTETPINYWNDLAWDGTKFVAISSLGYTSTSTDGVTWTTPVSSSALSNVSNAWYRIKWDGTRYVLLSYQGYVAYSTNLSTWTVYQAFNSNVWRVLMLHTEGSYKKYIAFQGITSGTIYSSTTTDITNQSAWTALQSWTETSGSNTGMVHEWRDGIYSPSNKKFVLIGENGWISLASAV